MRCMRLCVSRHSSAAGRPSHSNWIMRWSPREPRLCWCATQRPVRETSRTKTRCASIRPANGSSSCTLCRRRRSEDPVTLKGNLTGDGVKRTSAPSSEMRENPLGELFRARLEQTLVLLGGEVIDLVFVLEGRGGGADGDLAAVDG